MKSAAHIFLIAILLFVVNSGCRPSRERRQLSHAEAVMEEHPDSAYKMLESIDTGALSSAGDKALYYLLITQAMVKNDIPITSDSLIRIAVDYFSDHGRKTDKMKALFYLGQINYNNIDYPSAIVATMQARDIAKEMDSTYWQAKAAELQSFILSASYKHDEAITYSREAAELYKKSGHFINYLFSLTDLAIDYGNDGKVKTGLQLLDSIRSIPSIDTIPGLLEYNLQTNVTFNLKQGNYAKASELINSLLNLVDSTLLDSEDIINMAQICMGKGDFAGCYTHLSYNDSIAKSISEKVRSLQTYALIYKQQGLYQEALIVTDTILKYQNDKTKQVLKESVIAAQRDYKDRMAIENRDLAKKLVIWIISGIIVLIIISVALYFGHKVKAKLAKLELDRKINSIYQLTVDLQNKDLEYRDISNQFIQKEAEIKKLKDMLARQTELILTLSEHIKKENQVDSDKSAEVAKTLENQQNDITRLTSSLMAESENNSALRDTVENLFRNQWKVLNMLCAEYIDMEDMPDKTKLTIVNRIENKLKKLRSKESIQEIKDAVNQYMDDILNKLSEQCSFLSENDITFIGLIYAGLVPKAVSLLTGYKLKYFYTKKGRIIERIKKSGAPDTELFLSRLS